ncbi:CYTH domain-containing protein [Pedobacter sp. MC2016-24]|uniref:CYTH domain-containing protein n=1 Tax=Pedobacter sp. MC2016-24 TaxID=2780090 RepID=UPI0018813B6A|nr:CYTH domain-containing protein [Pedobacter sp. MC2016-24]MBE9600722.1 CYTH domain-containing protein [Pedobacter sp. MC2016-24]
MGVEIERKFLVDKKLWYALDKPDGKHYRQGYLLNGEDRVVRIRVAGDQGFITVKGAGEAITRLEYEYEIPKSDVQEMLYRFKPEGTEKIRYRIPEDSGLVWEVDEFLGANQGLIVAEIELNFEDQQFSRPDWLGREVTEDDRYSNSSLALRPIVPNSE